MFLDYLEGSFARYLFMNSPPGGDGSLHVRVQLWQRLAMYDEESRWVLYAGTANDQQPMFVVRKAEIEYTRKYGGVAEDEDRPLRLRLRQARLDTKTLAPFLDQLAVMPIPTMSVKERLGSGGLMCGIEFGERTSPHQLEWHLCDHDVQELDQWWQSFRDYLDESLKTNGRDMPL